MDNELLVKSIRKLCKENNITPAQLETKLNFGAGLISRWSKSSPSIDKIIDIADYFNVTLDEVVGRDIELNNSQDNDLLISLIQMTNSKEIKWEYIPNYENLQLNGMPYDEVFSLDSYGDEDIEIYKCKYHDSNLFLIARYIIIDGIINNLLIELYLQPDMESRPVIQGIDESYAENFWINIRKQYKGIPDELKADVIKNQIINQDFEITLDTMEQYISKIPNNKKDIEKLLKDKNAKKVLIEEDDPLIQQLVSTFSNQKLAQTIDATNKLVQYMSEIDKLRNKKDKQN